MADTDREKEILGSTDQRMSVSVDAFKQRLAAVRTGRASLAILDGISVDYYGTKTPLNQVAKLSVPEPTLILAQPFDQSTLQSIEKAIMVADLGLNPSNDGKLIRIPIPPLTEERRKQLIKKVHAMREDAKTAVRQVGDMMDKKKQMGSRLRQFCIKRAGVIARKGFIQHTKQLRFGDRAAAVK